MNIKTLLAAATITILPPQIHAEVFSGASSLPENAAAVYPTPDSRVDLGPNASPLGLQQISIMFTHDATVNPKCSEKAYIYKEGEDTPLQSVGIDGASVDLTQSKMGSVMFPNSCTANGHYRVTIPEGFWTLNGAGANYSGAFDLYYEILTPQRIWPSDPIVKELSEFRLEFPGYDEARLLDARKIEFFRHGSSANYPLSIREGKNEDGTPSNYILISLVNPVTEQGEYSLFVQAEAAEGVLYSEDSETTESSVTARDPNIEALYRYTVSQLDAPAIKPAEGVVETFSTFELTVPGGADFWFVNDKAVSYIYKVEPDGSLSTSAVYRLTGRRIGESDKIALTIMEGGTAAENVDPEAGSYALKLASGLFSGSWKGEFINSAPFVYYYQALGNPTGIRQNIAEDIMSGRTGIFTIDGRRIPEGSEGINTELLPEGIYIIDGQKKFINK